MKHIYLFCWVCFSFVYAQKVKIIEKTIVSTYAGSGYAGFLDGEALVAKFKGPNGICMDRFGNLFVGDDFNNRIRKVSAGGRVSVLAGSGKQGYKDGYNTNASFAGPKGVVADKSGNVYVADYGNHCIRKITSFGVVTTYAGSRVQESGYKNGNARDALFYHPIAMAMDYTDNIYVLETENHCIRKISNKGIVTTYAGTGSPGYKDGPAQAAQFTSPVGMCLDRYGNIYVVDAGNQCIRKVTPDGMVTTILDKNFSGLRDSTDGKQLRFFNTYGSNGGGVCSGPKDMLFIADGGSNCIFKVNLQRKVISVLAGTGGRGMRNGEGEVATFDDPVEICMDMSDNLYIADFHNNTIRKIEIKRTEIHEPEPIKPINPVRPSTFSLSGTVTDKQTGLPIVTDIIIEELGVRQNKKTIRTYTSGQYSQVMQPGTYNIYIQKTGYLPYQEEIIFPEKKNITLAIRLTEIKAGAKAVMRNVYFAPNSSTLTIDALAGLDRMVAFMKENLSVKIRINGHTDKGSTAEFNQKLSESRAISVKDYMVQMGIDENRIQTQGLGSTQPIADNGTIEGRSLNRRIEIEVIN